MCESAFHNMNECTNVSNRHSVFQMLSFSPLQSLTKSYNCMFSSQRGIVTFMHFTSHPGCWSLGKCEVTSLPKLIPLHTLLITTGSPDTTLHYPHRRTHSLASLLQAPDFGSPPHVQLQFYSVLNYFHSYNLSINKTELSD